MSDQQNVDVVKQGYEAFGRGDLEGLIGLLDESVEWQSPGPSDLPTAGQRQGRDQVRQFFGALNALYEFLNFAPQQFIAQGDAVVVTGISTVRVKATGNTLNEEWAHTFRVRDGKIVKFVEYVDTMAAVGELRAAQAKA